MSARRLLVVTGDDFGCETQGNHAIADCFRDGVLTHASMMVSEPAVEDAVQRARNLPGLSVGLHLVMCDGRAASSPATIPDLADPDGRFPRDPAKVGLHLWSKRRRVRPQIEREIRAQIECFLETGMSLTHVDGHHHLHAHPVIFEILRRLMTEYDIPTVRLMYEDRLGGTLTGGWIPRIHAALVRWHRFRDASLPDGRVYGLRASGRVDEAYLLALLPRLRAERVEIYCHPGRGPGGEREREALCSARVREAIERAGYALARGEGGGTGP